MNSPFSVTGKLSSISSSGQVRKRWQKIYSQNYFAKMTGSYTCFGQKEPIPIARGRDASVALFKATIVDGKQEHTKRYALITPRWRGTFVQGLDWHKQILEHYGKGAKVVAPYRLMEGSFPYQYIQQAYQTDLYKVIQNKQIPVRSTGDLFSPDIENKLDLAADVAEAISQCHQCNIIHGDVKTANVMIKCKKKGDCQARLGDFGLARSEYDISFSQRPVCLYQWMDSCAQSGYPTSRVTDIYGLACIIAATFFPDFNGYHYRNYLNQDEDTIRNSFHRKILQAEEQDREVLEQVANLVVEVFLADKKMAEMFARKDLPIYYLKHNGQPFQEELTMVQEENRYRSVANRLWEKKHKKCFGQLSSKYYPMFPDEKSIENDGFSGKLCWFEQRSDTPFPRPIDYQMKCKEVFPSAEQLHERLLRIKESINNQAKLEGG